MFITVPQEDLSRGRLPGAPIAIIDIGSNSVRLVIFERAARSPTSLFNEKLQAGLGRGVASTGRLNEAAVARALAAIARFKLLCANAGVEQLHIIATAAVREAANGAKFVADIEALLGTRVAVLSGREEAHYAALGVIAGMWRPNGIAADMGGGSLELMDVDGADTGIGETYPLGTLRIFEDADGRPKEAVRLAERTLRKALLLKGAIDRDLYLIGGSWRSLAKLHMSERDYPIRVMQSYAVPADEMRAFCKRVIDADPVLEDHLDAVSRSRRDLLPFGAAVLLSLIDVSQAKTVVISAFGVREGYIYATLDAATRAEDPLIASCLELAQLRSRSVAHVNELTQWLAQLIAALGLDETADQARLRGAACLLADVGWRGHPDHRAVATLADIAYASLSGVKHSERAYLALVLYYRYAGLAEPEIGEERALLDTLAPGEEERIRVLASGMRLAYVLSAAMPGTLAGCEVKRGDNDALLILVPERYAALDGERLRKRATHLTREVGIPVDVRIGDVQFKLDAQAKQMKR